MTPWRHFRVRPGAAHLWALTPGGVWRTHCARLCVLDLDETTVPLTVDNLKIRKCRVCLPQEPRRKEGYDNRQRSRFR